MQSCSLWKGEKKSEDDGENDDYDHEKEEKGKKRRKRRIGVINEDRGGGRDDEPAHLKIKTTTLFF